MDPDSFLVYWQILGEEVAEEDVLRVITATKHGYFSSLLPIDGWLAALFLSHLSEKGRVGRTF